MKCLRNLYNREMERECDEEVIKKIFQPTIAGDTIGQLYDKTFSFPLTHRQTNDSVKKE